MKWTEIKIPGGPTRGRYEDICVAGERIVAVHQSQLAVVLDRETLRHRCTVSLKQLIDETDLPRCVSFTGDTGFIGVLRNQSLLAGKVMKARLLYSTDGGLSWGPPPHDLGPGAPPNGLCGLDFDGRRLWAGGTRLKAQPAAVVMSSDVTKAGWRVETACGTMESLVDVRILGDGHGIACGSRDDCPAVWCTDDDGVTWTEVQLRFGGDGLPPGQCWKVFCEGQLVTITATARDQPHGFLIRRRAGAWSVEQVPNSLYRTMRITLHGVATADRNTWVGPSDEQLLVSSSGSYTGIREVKDVNRIIRDDDRLISAGKGLFYLNKNQWSTREGIAQDAS